MSELKPVKTAVVGCGMISTIYLKNMVNLLSITDVVAVCDVIEENAKARAEQFGIEKTMTLDEICADPEIEMVVNLTGPAQHYEVIKQLLEAGKNVYTEKLLCFDLEQGKELVKLADDKGLYLGVAPDTFLGAGLQTARQILDTGILGDITAVSAAINRNQPNNSEIFKYMPFLGGSFPYDVGVYYVTALLSLMGPAEAITGFAAPAPRHEGRLIYAGNYGKSWDLTGNNLQVAAVKFKSGVLGDVLFNGLSTNDEQPRLAIYGSKGIMYCGNPNNYDGEVTLVMNNEGSCTIPFTHGFKGTPLYGDPTPFDWGGHRGIGPAEMAWSMRKGRPPRASKEMGLHTVEFFHAIDTSSDEGKTYQMTTTFERPAALPSGHLCTDLGGFFRGDAEASLAAD